MAILRLSDGSLWVHSPVFLDDELKEALTQLGPVKHVVSPNYEHVKYAGQVRMGTPSSRVTCALRHGIQLESPQNLDLRWVYPCDYLVTVTCASVRAMHDCSA